MNKWYRLLRYDWPMHFTLLLTNWWPDNVVLIKLRGRMISPFLKKAGTNIQIGRGVTFYNPSNITIGSDVYIARGCWFSASEDIIIRDKILFGPYVVVVTSNHSIKEGAYFSGQPINKKAVIINDGAWIGAHSIILAGTNIGKTSLLAANSVMSGETEALSIYGGTPAKFLKWAKK